MAPQKKFTWKELISLNKEDNAHVAVRGKVNSENSLIGHCVQRKLPLCDRDLGTL